jgi:hypothetical protein
VNALRVEIKEGTQAIFKIKGLHNAIDGSGQDVRLISEGALVAGIELEDEER